MSGISTRVSQPEARKLVTEHAIFLGVASVTSAVMPILAASALLSLPAGTLALAYFVGRFVGAGINLFVNSILSVKYSWHEKPTEAPRLILILLTVGLLGSVAALILQYARSDAGTWVYLIPWASMITASSLLVRQAHARLSVRALSIKTTADLCVATTAVLALHANPSVIGYFATFTLSAAVTAVALAGRQRTLQGGAALIAVTSFLFLVAP
ncbi:hypothetical protein AYL44_10700 [Microbacterium oleivorans]|uniref:Uncharacterized protein n=1 Tax=Microbacterium oleivorans TaxID=273677 RepID=A0A177K9R2_9MICO|nr:hypothetical protein AYL44_10700 [Microbacterium oleivorans]